MKLFLPDFQDIRLIQQAVFNLIIVIAARMLCPRQADFPNTAWKFQLISGPLPSFQFIVACPPHITLPLMTL